VQRRDENAEGQYTDQRQAAEQQMLQAFGGLDGRANVAWASACGAVAARRARSTTSPAPR